MNKVLQFIFFSIGIIWQINNQIIAKVVIEKVSVENDLSIGRTSVNFSTAPGESSLIDVHIEIWKVLENVKVDFRLGLPESDHDTKYLRQLFRSNIDVKAITRGLKGNTLIQAAIETFLKGSNFKLKLPFQPGNYSVRNIQYTGEVLPPISAQFLVDIRGYVKLKDKKKMTLPLFMKFYGKLN